MEPAPVILGVDDDGESLAHGGTGLGALWGEQRARKMLADVGFAEVAAHAAPGDPINPISVTTKPGA